MSAVKSLLGNGKYQGEGLKPVLGLPRVKQADSRAQGTPEASILGINAKSAAIREMRQREARRQRWARLGSVRVLLEGERVAKCMWTQIAFTVEHWKSEIKKPSHFRAVATCGSVWVCPICAAKITERRREEIQIAVAEAKERGWTVFMITATLQHNKDQAVGLVLKKLLGAWRKLKQDMWWKTFAKKYSLVGSITALEVTYSFSNGSHPHKHDLEISARSLSKEDLENMRDELQKKWEKVLKLFKGYADYEIGIDVKAGDDYIAEYIAKFGREPKDENKKWGVAYEMAKYPVKGKSAIDGHYTMFQMIDLYEAGNLEAGKVFVEYYMAFKGRRQLTWSRGLKKELGVIEATDAEISKAKEQTDKCFALYKKDDWHKVRKIPLNVLEASEKMNFDAFREYCAAKGIEAENPIFELVNDG